MSYSISYDIDKTRRSPIITSKKNDCDHLRRRANVRTAILNFASTAFKPGCGLVERRDDLGLNIYCHCCGCSGGYYAIGTCASKGFISYRATNSWHQRNRGRARKKDAADAQLKLDQWLAKKVIARFADPKDFETLKRFPPAQVEVLYKEGDGEAFMYAATILQLFQSMGWKTPKQSKPTTHHPVMGNEGNPIIGTFVLAKHIPHSGEVFEEMKLPLEKRSLPVVISYAVKGNLLESPTMPENKFVIVVGEYLRDWTP